jgi:ABC-type branched-subunit amino acid transport system ATPase component
MMMIEHRMESIIADCNRLLVIEQGRTLIPRAAKEVADVAR